MRVSCCDTCVAEYKCLNKLTKVSLGSVRHSLSKLVLWSEEFQFFTLARNGIAERGKHLNVWKDELSWKSWGAILLVAWNVIWVGIKQIRKFFIMTANRSPLHSSPRAWASWRSPSCGWCRRPWTAAPSCAAARPPPSRRTARTGPWSRAEGSGSGCRDPGPANQCKFRFFSWAMFGYLLTLMAFERGGTK